jgi:hypothetical protein
MATLAGNEHSGGRIIRTLLAVFVLLLTAALLVAKYVYQPLLEHQPIPDLSIVEGGFHLLMVIMAVLMYDPDTGKDLWHDALAKLPFGKAD